MFVTAIVPAEDAQKGGYRPSVAYGGWGTDQGMHVGKGGCCCLCVKAR